MNQYVVHYINHDLAAGLNLVRIEVVEADSPTAAKKETVRRMKKFPPLFFQPVTPLCAECITDKKVDALRIGARESRKLLVEILRLERARGGCSQDVDSRNEGFCSLGNVLFSQESLLVTLGALPESYSCGCVWY